MTNEVFLTREEIEHPYANLTVMLEDKRRKAEQMSKTVFAKITASPDVLAEAIVYEECEHSILNANGCGATFPGGYTSAILEYSYQTKAEAIAATVAKLKEVVE